MRQNETRQCFPVFLEKPQSSYSASQESAPAVPCDLQGNQSGHSRLVPIRENAASAGRIAVRAGCDLNNQERGVCCVGPVEMGNSGSSQRPWLSCPEASTSLRQPFRSDD